MVRYLVTPKITSFIHACEVYVVDGKVGTLAIEYNDNIPI